MYSMAAQNCPSISSAPEDAGDVRRAENFSALGFFQQRLLELRRVFAERAQLDGFERNGLATLTVICFIDGARGRLRQLTQDFEMADFRRHCFLAPIPSHAYRIVATNLRRPEIPGIAVGLEYRRKRQPSSYQSKGNRPAVTAIWEGRNGLRVGRFRRQMRILFLPQQRVEDPAISTLRGHETCDECFVCASARQSLSALTSGVREMGRNFLHAAAVVFIMWSFG